MSQNWVKVIDLMRNPVTDEVVNTNESITNYETAKVKDNGYKAFSFLEADGRPTRMSLQEAFLSQPDAANLLRSDLRFLAFDQFEQMPRSFDSFTQFVDSNKPQEEYLRDANPGVMPKVPSGQPVPEMMTDFEGGTIIKNYRYAAMWSVLGDWIRFDQLGKVNQLGRAIGRSARMTEENAVYEFLTTTANYTRNSTTKDNTVGANQQTLTFDIKGLSTGLSVIGTSRDRKNGAYLGYSGDTIITTPLMEPYVKQLLLSTELERGATGEVQGTGTFNPMFGRLNQIIVTPWFGTSYQWAVCDSTAMGLMYQTVEAMKVEQENPNITSEAYLIYDKVRYLSQGYFGVGFADDRAWFYSDSTTEPTVN